MASNLRSTIPTSLRGASRFFNHRIFSPVVHHHHHHHHGHSTHHHLTHHPKFPLSSSFFSTLRRNPASRSSTHLKSPKPDIAARARQLQTRRLWTYALAFSGVAGFVVLVLNNFQDQLVFYVTPTDALEKLKSNPNKQKFRLGGLVLEGSVNQPAGSSEMEFVITDLITDILVRYQGSLPDLFREGHSVVVEGLVKPLSDEIRREEAEGEGISRGKEVTAKARSGEYYFAASEVLAKHDEKYMPAEVASAIEKNKKIIEAEAEEKRNSAVAAAAPGKS